MTAGLPYWLNMVLTLPVGLSFYPMNELLGTGYLVDFEGNAGELSHQIHVNCCNNILKIWRPEKKDSPEGRRQFQCINPQRQVSS